jgi:DNA-binding CsgD family transcriptional regulator
VITRDLDARALELTHRDLDLEGVCHAFDRLLRGAVPYVAAAWSTHDPATGLFTSCTLTGIEEDRQREARLFDCEFIEDEPGSCLSLIERGETVSILSEITDGDLNRARRYREVFSAFGVTDELRLILWADERAWASVSMYRLDSTFTRDEAAAATRIAPYAAHAIRLALLRMTAMRPGAVDDPPGIVQVHADASVTALTEPARRWLELGGTRLVTAVNVAAAAVRGHRDWAGAASRLLLQDGRVLSLQAASMTGDGQDVAVIVDAARPVEIGAMLVDAYGLTRRQREVLGLLLLGRSMIEIARELGISEHTANDHRKAIYRRMDVSSRSELAALLQAEQYTPRSVSGVPPSPYGGFLPA